MAALDQALTSVLNVQRGTYVQYSVLTYASYIYKGSGFCKIIFVALLALMLAYHKLYYTKSLGADGYPEQFHDPVITQPGKVN